MKIDYDEIKRYLGIWEKSNLPFVNTKQIFEALQYSMEDDEHGYQVMFYLKLLNDQGLIECFSPNEKTKETLGFSVAGRQGLIITITNFRLTNAGHQTLEVLNHNKVWEKIKGPLGKVGIESLKEIPALAIKFFLSAV